MTFEEAKKILEKEFAVINLHKSTEPFEFDDSNWFGYEKPSVLEAFRVLSKEGYYITISGHDYDMRKKRLEKEYEKNTKAPGPGEEQSKEGNPALAESASQFNDALLDEQAKKIAELTKDKELMKKATLSQLDDFIEIYNLLTKESQKTKRLGKEIAKLNGIIHDENAILSDVAEELRLSKIREKNLTEVCQKYVKEVEDLREQLANKVVDKIDAQALKSAESALAWKEKLIYYKDMAIADLRKELKAQKGLVNHISKKYDGAKINLNLRMKECEELREKVAEKTKLVEIVRKGSREYCEYGIAAEKMIQKMAKDIVNDRPVSPKDYEQYRHWAKGYRFNPQLPERTDEEEKKPNTSKSTLDDLKEKAYNSFNAKACNLGLVGSKDGNGITDQMEEEKKLSPFRDDSVGAVTNQKDCYPIKDTHPTEDNPEEVEMDEILEFVRKALEEGHTVSIDYDKAEEGGDQSATIVECGKDIDDVFKEIKRLCQE